MFGPVDVTYTVEVHNEGTDGVWATVVELPGCFASGENLDELMENLNEAISLYISDVDSPMQARFNRTASAVEKQEFHLETVLV